MPFVLNLEDVLVPAMPLCVADAFTCLNGEDPDVRALADVMGRDPGLSARILSLANSAAMGAGHPTSSLIQALGRIGLAPLRQVLLDFAISGTLRGKEKIYDWRKLWRHSSVTGQLALRLGANLAPSFASELHIAGLLHDVGLFLLGQNAPDLLQSLTSCCQREGKSISQAEHELLIPSHGPLGAMAVTHWNFPPLVSILIHHHELRDPRERPSLSPEDNRLVSILALADALALRFDAVPPGFSVQPVSPGAFGFPELGRDTVLKAVESAKAMADLLVME